MNAFSRHSPVLILLAAAFSLTHAPAQAQSADQATPASDIHILDGFTVERIYSVPRGQGSWIAIYFDSEGRLYACEQGKKLFRLTPPPPGQETGAEVELVSSEWAGNAQGMAFINDSLYLMRNGNHHVEGFVPDSLVRLSDSDGDDVLDEEEHLCDLPSTPGEQAAWSEHGMHAVVPGPDGKTLYVISGDRNPLPSERGLAPPRWNYDVWGAGLPSNPNAGGWVMRANLDGKDIQHFAVGLRNSYDLAFNHHGDLFTFDSDLEFDIGLPDYRPTSIRHVLSGTDGGWRGRGGHMMKNLVPAFEEIQPPVKDIGPGSPTGICFGYGAKFPARYQRALFACDWSYGRLFAVHLQPDGASYRAAEVDTFLSAQGLPIADIAVSPKDGALYFVIGGRGTSSGVYRVTYGGEESTAPAPEPALPPAEASLREKRVALEALHGKANSEALPQLWPELAHQDRAIRAAARIALEWQPVAAWKEKALNESNPRILLQALLAMARSTNGEKPVQAELLAALERLDFARLGADEKSWYLRVLTVSAIRHGSFANEVAAALVERLAPALPDADRRVNVALVTMLAHFGSDRFVAPALDLLEQCRTQEDQVTYVQQLLKVSPQMSEVWTPETRERFFEVAAEKIALWKGGSNVPRARNQALDGVIGLLDEEQKSRLAERIAGLRKPPATVAVTGRSFVKQWTLEDLAPALEDGLKQERDLENGRAMYAAGACIACHNFQGEGGLAGPDLSSAGSRYNAHDLLDNILNPSKVINEQYGLLVYTRKDGTVLQGRTVNMVHDQLMIATSPLDPGGSRIKMKRGDFASIEPSPVSFMPPGLLNTFTQDDVLDLLAYLRQLPAGIDGPPAK